MKRGRKPQKEEWILEVRKQIRVRNMDDESDMGQIDRNAGCGELPSLAPLANPYVPFQQNNP